MRLKALGCLVVGAAGFAAGGVGAGGVGAAADPGRTFAASAEAEGMRVTFEAPQFLIVSTLFDAANPVSQATLESTGVSRSFASAPYPGDLVVTAPGTLAAFGGPSLPAQYPFYVAADHPATPEASLDDPAGAYGLAATAAATRSGATGRLSVENGPTVRTEARTETLADGTVRAVADTVAEGIVAGDGVLTVGRVTSRVETVYRPGAAEPAVTRHFEIVGARVGDTAVEITADGVRAGNGAVPAGPAAAPVQAALARAGLDVRIEGQEGLRGGGTARVLVIRSAQQAPLPGAPEGVLTVWVGGAATAVLTGAAAVVEVPGSLGAAPPASFSGPDGSSGPNGAPNPDESNPDESDPDGSGQSGDGAGAPRPDGGAGAAGEGAPFGTSPGGTVPALRTDPAPGSSGTDTEAAAGSQGTGLAGPDTAPIVSVPTAEPVRRAVRTLFAVLGAGGALALAGSASFRRQGVQSTWTS